MISKSEIYLLKHFTEEINFLFYRYFVRAQITKHSFTSVVSWVCLTAYVYNEALTSNSVSASHFNSFSLPSMCL